MLKCTSWKNPQRPFLCLTITQPNLKGQERSDRAGSTTSLQKHIGEIRQKMPRGKNYQKFPSNTQKKISATEKVLRISHTWKHTKIFNGSYNFEYRER